MTELKPCPFCGSTDIMIHGEYYCWIRCLKCGVETPGSANREEVIDFWNRRAHDTYLADDGK